MSEVARPAHEAAGEDKFVRTSYQLWESQAARLQDVAHDLGFIQGRGPGAGVLPNVSALLRALADVDRATLVTTLRALGVGPSKA